MASERKSADGESSSGEYFVDLTGAKPETEPVLKQVDKARRVAITWHSVDATVPVFNAAGAASTLAKRLRRRTSDASDGDGKAEKTRKVLFSLKGTAQPGEVVGLMGPSGSGKTSLLSMIGGRKPPKMTVSGQVLFNGEKMNKHIKRSIGFVLQDDRLFETLTVEETLVFAARLRLPRSMDLSEKLARVGAVIDVLGLQKCKDTLIGGAMRRGVSGGERKRVSVGHELLTDPAVLLLDEPTSGLDATTAMNLFGALRQLASGGRTVMATIHQPSSRLYQQLDHLVLLADGHCMYSGRGALAHEYFAALGCPLELGVNIADFILDLASDDFTGCSVPGDTASDKKAHLITVSEQFLEHCEDGYQGYEDKQLLQQLHARGAGSKEVEVLSGASRRSLGHDAELLKPTSQAWLGASFLEQLGVLLVRSSKVKRFDALAGAKLGTYVGAASVAALLWFQRGNGEGSATLSAAADLSALLFFQLIFQSFSLMFAALFTFPEELGMLLKESASGMYRLSAYYLARSTAGLPLDLFYPTIFTLIIYFTSGLRLSAAAFLGNLIGVTLTILVAQSWGLVLGAATGSVAQAQTTCTVIMLSFMLVSGFWIQGIPYWMSWLKYLSFIYWGYSLSLKLQFGNSHYVDCMLHDAAPANDLAGDDCRPVPDLSDALNFPRDAEGAPWLEIVALLAMLIVLRYLGFLLLWQRVRHS